MNLDAPAFDEYMAIVILPGGHYRIHRWNADKPLASFIMRRRKYAVRKEKAALLKGWYPWTQVRFFQSIIDTISHRFVRIGVLLYEEPKGLTDEVIEPLDRINASVAKPQPIDVLTPNLHRTIADSRVWSDRMRKLSFGQTVSLKVLIVVLVAVLALMIVLNMGGFFG